MNMNTIKISSKSWHYRLVEKLDRYVDAEDICSYTRQVLWSLFLVGFIFAFLLMLGYILFGAIGSGVAWIAAMITVFGWLEPNDNALLFCALLIFIGIAVCIWLWVTNEVYVKLDIPVIKKAYSAWKGKYCMRIEIE
jgi:hypothetical protein